jgi:SAM-dependent methyltransferase
MSEQSHDQVRAAVRGRYAEIATLQGGSCCGGAPSCCDPAQMAAGSAALGYSADELAAVPEGANLGLGCGNPQQLAALRPGETVLDLGSGAGFDCFLAARHVGAKGRVIGVDMTPDMVSKARANAAAGQWEQVEFRLGEIEHLPVADASVDVILSNCVINLSPDKGQVFREALRVLRPGGRLAISDVVALGELPASFKEDMAVYAGCVSGAIPVVEVERLLREAGFHEVRVEVKEESRTFIKDWFPGTQAEAYVASAAIEAIKPR